MLVCHDSSLKAERNVFLAANRATFPFLVNLHGCFQSDVMNATVMLRMLVFTEELVVFRIVFIL